MKIVLSLSGGLDSTVLLYHLKYRLGNEVLGLSVNYGQRHERELLAAGKIAALNHIDHKTVDFREVGRMLMGGSSQTSADIEVPLGHYEAESMKQTVVPNRNMILLALAGAWAVSSRAEAVAYAAHAGDHAIYPDCRPAFAEAMEDAFKLCDWHPVKLLRPFVYPDPLTKATIVRIGSGLGVPFQTTYSCYRGAEKHCGRCGTCVERREAFQVAGVKDPTEYEG